MRRDQAQGGSTLLRARTDGDLVVTTSSVQPRSDGAEERWQRRPVVAALIRVVVIGTPLVASVLAGIAAGRLFRPQGWVQIAEWVLWTAAVSIAVLAAVDGVVRRLLPLQRLLQLCLVFPDKAPSRLKVAARAARLRRSHHHHLWHAAPADAAEAIDQIVVMLGTLARHDRRTRGHSERVCAFTELIAGEMELSQRDRDLLMWVALIHDIGKLEVPPRLLNKPAKPTLPEWQVLQAHPHHGDRIIAPLRSWLGPWADAVVQHHERYDGLGYPHGLAGDELCVGARIIAVADAFEVMTAPRPYRRPVNAAVARSELARHAGTQFDPDVVRHFLAVGLPKLRTSMGLLSWLAQIPFVRSWPKLQSTPGVAVSQAGTVTLVSSTTGAVFLTSAAAAPAMHDVAAGPLSPATTAPAAVAPAASTEAPAKHQHPAKTNAHTPTASTVRGSTSAGAVTSAPLRHSAPSTSNQTTSPPAAAPTSCQPHGKGHHYGWAHHPGKHDGCG